MQGHHVSSTDPKVVGKEHQQKIIIAPEQATEHRDVLFIKEVFTMIERQTISM